MSAARLRKASFRHVRPDDVPVALVINERMSGESIRNNLKVAEHNGSTHVLIDIPYLRKLLAK